MLAKDIHGKLSGIFSGAIAEWVEPKIGDPSVVVQAEKFHDVCEFLKRDEALAFDFLRLVTGVDRGESLSSVYHLYSYKHNHALVLRVDLPRANPELASVCDLWTSANWHERECFDMLGIVYCGHPELRRILLPLDWEGFPLRKDYKAPDAYHGIKHG